jgi:short-subunit dehydrogenase
MRRQGWGRIVNVSSVMGRVSVPFLGMYCASKFAVEALSDAQRVELRGSGVGVSVIEPGPIATAFRRNAVERAQATLVPQGGQFGALYRSEIERRERRGKATDVFTRPPEAVAAKVVHALESHRPRRRYCVTVPAHFGALAARFLPAAVRDAILSRRIPRV